MNVVVENFSNPIFIIDFSISVVVLAVISFFMLYIMKRKFVIISIIASDLIFIVSKIFSLTTLNLLTLAFMIASWVIYVFINGSEYRYFVLNNVKTKRKAKKEKSDSSVALYKMMDETVKNLSRTKTGAIITFEKTTNLNDIIKNGTVLNAPVCQELLLTIFYPGTRLHDGAVVIRGDKIIAASVYYTPTTRALTGKYGSRHRAAFGISEISDAVTIVVSEETGRISLTYKGRMESCTYDSFIRDFSSMMEDQDEE